MTTESSRPARSREASTEDASYDYQSDDVARPGMVRDLESLIDGDVRFDRYTRQLYATDASLYSITPVGVVFPTSTADVSAVVEYCAERSIPVLPRGGGTSLAGQTVNEAVVLDFTRHMDDLLDVNLDTKRARAQPGITLGRLNQALDAHDLKFAPDPAWGDKSALGGAIGNNSTGSHSLQYGKTDAYVESCEVVLADGTVTTFEAVDLDELRERGDPEGDLEARIYDAVAQIVDEKGDLIEGHYPDLKRNVSGYNLDWLIEDVRGAERDVGEPDAAGGTVNLAKLLCGSEGTLAIVTEAEIALEPIPETKSLALLCYEGLLDAVADVEAILEHDPAAVELVDDVLIDLARETPEFSDVVEELPPGTDSALLVEFYAEDRQDGERTVDDLVVDRAPAEDERVPAENAGALAENAARGSVEAAAEVRAIDALEAHDEATRERFWKLRKSGLPILLSRTTDAKHVSFVEDAAVPPEHLPGFVEDFQAVLDEHDTFASFYGHAGPGVLHVRPLVNTTTESGLADLESIADAVTDLVVEYGGSVSGEHGDGRARTQWNRKRYGEELWATFQELKSAFDPDWLLNPGQVVFRDDDPTDMTEHLRHGPDDEVDVGFDPTLQWEVDNGFRGMAELCHGCGGCRGDQDTTGGVMCPTYRAADEEILSTRGRANMLRSAMTGDLDSGEQFTDEFVTEVLDLCIGCKGCKRDCPSGVDMAKLKAELTHEYHEREGASLRDRLFSNFERLARLGSATAPASNWLTKLPGARFAMEKTLGIASERDLPTFHRRTLRDRAKERGIDVGVNGTTLDAIEDTEDTRRKALLLPDLYTNYLHPESGEAALDVLEAADVRVAIPDVTDTGRPAFSKGFLDRARETAESVVDVLAPLVEDGWDVVVVEPSDAVMLQSDYRDLLSGPGVDRVAESTYGVCEYLDRFGLDQHLDATAPEETLTYHGHCHQKSTKKDHYAVGVLRRVGYEVDPLDSGCCGMAGSFGYEADHYSMSEAIAGVLYEQVAASDGDRVVAPGASCRTQLGDRDGAEEPQTPIEALSKALE